MPRTRPIVRAPQSTEQIEQGQIALVGRNGRRVAPRGMGRNALGQKLAGRKTNAGGGRLKGGVWNGPVGV